MKIATKLLVLFFLLSAAALKAQDKIYHRSGNTITVKVIEVNEDHIVYKNLSVLDGPSYSIAKENILKIVYANGVIETFERNTDRESIKARRKNTDYLAGYGHHIVAVDFMSIVFSDFGFSYEYFLKNGLISVKLPVIIGINTALSNENLFRENRYQAGIDLNIYPAGQSKTSYFIGPGFRIGEMYDSYTGVNGLFTSYSGVDTMTVRSLQINNGVLFQPSKRCSASIVLGLGVRNLTNVNRYNARDQSYKFFSFGANFGFRF